MDPQSLPNHYKPVIATEACSPELICGVHDVSKRITQLNKTGDNFSVWERNLKAMIRTLTGSSEYFLRELHTVDPKFNRAIFHLIFWSIDEDLQQDLNIDGSAGEAFQALSDRFRSNTSARCIMSRADFPEEILDNIVNMVYYSSFEDQHDIRHRKVERIRQQDQGRQVYVNHGCPPILNDFQNLAVVNRKFHRLCLPKLWQHLQFPSALPAPVSLWTGDILSRHGHLVKSLKFELEDLTDIEDDPELSALERLLERNLLARERSHQDNTSAGRSYFVDSGRQGIGVRNIRKLFRACPSLASVAIDIPPNYSDEPELFSSIKSGLQGSFDLAPRLQHLTLKDAEGGKLPGAFVIDIHKHIPSLVSLEIIDFQFGPTESTEKSLGWNLAQHRNLRKLRLENVTCEDQTWTLNFWPPQLTTLDLDGCDGLTPGLVPKLFSGSAPFLTTLEIKLIGWDDDSDVNGQTDVPALQRLVLCDQTSFKLLQSFQGCKDLEMIKYDRPLKNDQWDVVKRLLHTRTWPKLSSLHLSRHPPWEGSIDRPNWRKITKRDVYEVWSYYFIKLVIS